MFEISVFGAFFAGLLSFLSPCILPIVPFYLSYMAGVSMNQISSGQEIPTDIRRRAVISTLFFSAGIIFVFMAFGVSATLLGQVFRQYFDILRWIAATIIILMGLHFLGVLRIGFLHRQLRADFGSTSKMSYAGAFVVGLAFAFGWTPCVGPVLAAILFTASAAETVSKGAGLLFFFGAGMTLPFVLAALFIKPFMLWMGRFKKHIGKIEKIMGVMLIIFGVLIATNSMNYIAQWMLSVAPDIGVLR